MKDAHHPIGESAELAALYSTGAMTNEETMEFERHLSTGCDRCSAELAGLDPVVAELLGSVEPVPVDERIREALLARIRAGATPKVAKAVRKTQVWRDWGSDDAESDLIIRRAAESGWEDTDIAGIQTRRLFVDRSRNQMTALVRMAAGTAYPGHVHNGPEECLVLEGDLRAGDRHFFAGDYQRMTTGSLHGIQSTDNGCLLLIVSSLSDELV